VYKSRSKIKIKVKKKKTRAQMRPSLSPAPDLLHVYQYFYGRGLTNILVQTVCQWLELLLYVGLLFFVTHFSVGISLFSAAPSAPPPSSFSYWTVQYRGEFSWLWFLACLMPLVYLVGSVAVFFGSRLPALLRTRSFYREQLRIQDERELEYLEWDDVLQRLLRVLPPHDYRQRDELAVTERIMAVENHFITFFQLQDAVLDVPRFSVSSLFDSNALWSAVGMGGGGRRSEHEKKEEDEIEHQKEEEEQVYEIEKENENEKDEEVPLFRRGGAAAANNKTRPTEKDQGIEKHQDNENENENDGGGSLPYVTDAELCQRVDQRILFHEKQRRQQQRQEQLKLKNERQGQQRHQQRLGFSRLFYRWPLATTASNSSATSISNIKNDSIKETAGVYKERWYEGRPFELAFKYLLEDALFNGHQDYEAARQFAAECVPPGGGAEHRDRWARRFAMTSRLMALAIVVSMPVLLGFLLVMGTFEWAQQLRANPAKLLEREWTCFVSAQYRELNELPHRFELRMQRARAAAGLFYNSLRYSPLAHVARTVSFAVSLLLLICAVQYLSLFFSYSPFFSSSSFSSSTTTTTIPLEDADAESALLDALWNVMLLLGLVQSVLYLVYRSYLDSSSLRAHLKQEWRNEAETQRDIMLACLHDDQRRQQQQHHDYYPTPQKTEIRSGQKDKDKEFANLQRDWDLLRTKLTVPRWRLLVHELICLLSLPLLLFFIVPRASRRLVLFFARTMQHHRRHSTLFTASTFAVPAPAPVQSLSNSFLSSSFSRVAEPPVFLPTAAAVWHSAYAHFSDHQGLSEKEGQEKEDDVKTGKEVAATATAAEAAAAAEGGQAQALSLFETVMLQTLRESMQRSMASFSDEHPRWSARAGHVARDFGLAGKGGGGGGGGRGAGAGPLLVEEDELHPL
jgi:hypothetical protein